MATNVRASVRLLSRLTNVRQTGTNRWIGSCPTAAHRRGDRSRGLSIREVDDRVLIHCHAGCRAAEIMETLGLALSDLYDRQMAGDSSRAPPPVIPASDLLVIFDHEITVAALILQDVVTGRQVNESQVQRLSQAAARIGRARDLANPAKMGSRAA